MKIAIVHHQFAHRGGMESYLHDLIAEFGNQGDQVTFFTYKVAKNSTIPSNYHIKKINLNFVPRKWRKFVFIWYINRYFPHQDFDLSLNTTRTSSQDFAICGGTHRGFLKYMGRKTKLKDRLEIYCETLSFKNSPSIIAHSAMMQNEIKDLYQINPQKIHLLYPPVNNGRFKLVTHQQKEEYINKFNLSKNKTKLLFASTGHKRKGWSELYAAFKQLPATEFELIIAGSPIAHHEHLANIKSLGFVANMEELYAACDFTILPSHYEPFGLTVVESLECGTPVIISKFVGAKDLIDENEGVICQDVTAKNITKAILQATEKQFSIAPNFIARHHLTVSEHVNAIKNLLHSQINHNA